MIDSKLEELRIQAWKYANNYVGDDIKPQLQRFEEKFAELIVQTIADSLPEHSLNLFDERCAYSAAQECGRIIKEYFGVE